MPREILRSLIQIMKARINSTQTRHKGGRLLVPEENQKIFWKPLLIFLQTFSEK